MRKPVSSVIALAVALAASGYVWAVPVPLGGQFQVNSYTPMTQFGPRVASDSSGNFVVAWGSYASAGTDHSFTSVQARRFTNSGTPLGADFQVNTSTFAAQFAEGVAIDSAGNFVVSWGSYGSPNVAAQWYDATGAPQGMETGVASVVGSAGGGAVGMDPAGNAVVVWFSLGSPGSDTSSYSAQARRFDSARLPIGAQFQVNTYTTGFQGAVDVAVNTSGDFIIAMENEDSSGSDTSGDSVQVRRYDASGLPVGTEFQVNSYTTGDQEFAAVATDGTGNFIVAWVSDGSAETDSSQTSILARRYDNNGLPLSGEFQVNTYTTYNQRDPDVAVDSAGNFVVVWTSYGGAGSDTSSASVQAQAYDAMGLPNGGEFQVNSYTSGFQGRPTVAVQAVGAFVVTWSSQGGFDSDISYVSIQAQRFVEGSTTTSTSSTSSTSLPRALPGRLGIIKPGTLAKFVAKPATGDTFVLPTANPVSEGGSLRIFDTAATAGDNSYTLPLGANWKGLGNPAGSRGYRYTGAGTPTDPCKVVVVKERVVKAVCKGAGITLTPPFTGDVGIVLSLGTAERYCAQFGGDDVRNDATLTRRKNAPAPGVCP